MCHCGRPFYELLIAGTCVFIAGTWLFIAGSWLFIDTKQLLQDAPIIPDQFWGPKNFARKVIKKAPKSIRKVTEMTLK